MNTHRSLSCIVLSILVTVTVMFVLPPYAQTGGEYYGPIIVPPTTQPPPPEEPPVVVPEEPEEPETKLNKGQDKVLKRLAETSGLSEEEILARHNQNAAFF